MKKLILITVCCLLLVGCVTKGKAEKIEEDIRMCCMTVTGDMSSGTCTNIPSHSVKDYKNCINNIEDTK